jgi:hypothetical protein
MMHKNCQEVARSTLVKGIESKMAALIWHTVPGYCAIFGFACSCVCTSVTLVIALPLDQVLQAVVTHSAIQYSLDLILFPTLDESWGWGWSRLLARDGIRMRKGQLDHGKDWVEAAEVGGRARQYAPWPTQASMTKRPKCQ